MLQPRRKGTRFYFPLHAHPLARVLKFERFASFLAALPATSSRVVDYGSGDRPYENLLRTRFAEYISVDYRITNDKHGKRPDIYIEEMRERIAPESVDCVILTEVMEHLYEPREVLRELYGILKPGGHLIGTVPFANGEHEQPYDFYRYTSFCLRRMFTEAGFRIERLDYVGDMVGVALSATTRILQLIPKALRRIRLGWVAAVVGLVIKIPEFAYYYLRRFGLDPQRASYFRNFPLGYAFHLQKPAARTED